MRYYYHLITADDCEDCDDCDVLMYVTEVGYFDSEGCLSDLGVPREVIAELRRMGFEAGEETESLVGFFGSPDIEKLREALSQNPMFVESAAFDLFMEG